MVYIKASQDIAINFEFIIRNGISTLRDAMVKARRFDPTNPLNYDEKNEYFNEANTICQYSLWQFNLYDFSERYYERMLKEIRNYEKKNNTNFNKGMVYANLGVSQIAQGKIDEGFANILKAQMEDEPYTADPSKSVFQNPLYTQFEDGKQNYEGIKDYILKHTQLYQTEEQITIDKAYLTELISSLDTDSRILFISVIEKNRRQLGVMLDKDNRFTRLHLLSCLQDICRAIENGLKVKNTINGDLKNLLDDLFSTRRLGARPTWKATFDANYNLCSANSILELKNNLEQILTNIADNKAKRMLLCCLMRNFCAHNLDVGNDYVFEKVRDYTIFDNLISVILFLHSATYI